MGDSRTLPDVLLLSWFPPAEVFCLYPGRDWEQSLHGLSVAKNSCSAFHLWLHPILLCYGLEWAMWSTLQMLNEGETWEWHEWSLFDIWGKPIPGHPHKTPSGTRGLHEAWIERTNIPRCRNMSCVPSQLHSSFRPLIPRVLSLQQGGNVTLRSGFKCWSNACAHVWNCYLLGLGLSRPVFRYAGNK